MTNPYRAMCSELLADYDNCHYRSDLSDRARALLDQPVAGEPTDQEIAKFLADQYKARMDNQSAFGCPDFDGSKAKAAQIADARAVLARWGRPTPQPVAVSERLQAVEALAADAVSGLRYIEQTHGRLYGVGWDRVFDAAAKFLPANALPTPEATND